MFIPLIFILIFIILILIIFCCSYSFRRLSIFKKVKNKFIIWSASCIPMVLLFFIFNYVNSIIIIFHYVIISSILYLIFKLIKKENNDLVVILSVIITALYIGYGAYQNYHITETKYEINTSKYIGEETFRIIMMSDAHIGASFDGEGFKKEIEKISKIQSDLFVFVGDFIDDDTKYEDMLDACEAFSLLNPKYGVYFVNGNHDRLYSRNDKFTYNNLLEALKDNGVKVLIDDVVNINDYVVLVGREDKRSSRKDIDILVKDIDKSKYIIDLNHQPNDYENEKNKVDLVLSGHTHGGQLFPLAIVSKYINANDETYGLHTRDNTNYIVTSGISGWAVDFKTGTHSEYVVIDIKGRSNE